MRLNYRSQQISQATSAEPQMGVAAANLYDESHRDMLAAAVSGDWGGGWGRGGRKREERKGRWGEGGEREEGRRGRTGGGRERRKMVLRVGAKYLAKPETAILQYTPRNGSSCCAFASPV